MPLLGMFSFVFLTHKSFEALVLLQAIDRGWLNVCSVVIMAPSTCIRKLGKTNLAHGWQCTDHLDAANYACF